MIYGSGACPEPERSEHALYLNIVSGRGWFRVNSAGDLRYIV